MREILDVTDKLVIDYRARDWCKLPYPDHPKGCPNYGKKWGCPPQAPPVEDWIDTASSMWFVCVGFDLQGHIDRMKLKHPHWTDRQAKCVLYWQGTVNKELKEATWDFVSGKVVQWTYCPEAMGVQVIKTAQNVGLPIKPRPEGMVYKIALVGSQRG